MIVRGLTNDDRDEAGRLLASGFRDFGSAEFISSTGIERTLRVIAGPASIARVAVEEGKLVGLIGGLLAYHGHVVELHPLVVHPHAQRKGIGRALVAELEREAAKRGAMTMWVGTDDLDSRTSVGGVDLYPGVLENLSAIRNLCGHPFEFYKRVGFAMAGVLPDANGFGKPNIFMAKRIKPVA
jgi:aminoglycoside 6'-N-acetyltransferase I